jgi:hypothetical protein
MPPTGVSPPLTIRDAAGHVIDLVPLALHVCRQYQLEFPAERERYGPAGHAWCVHDNHYILAWAIQDARDGTISLDQQVAWLADVLEARGFPLERLARDLEIAATVLIAGVKDGRLASQAASRLIAAAANLGDRR